MNVCEAPLLAAEVYDLIRNNCRNDIAFGERDPLDNPEIVDSDELRRLVTSRRIVHYFDNCLSLTQVSAEILPTALRILSTYKLSRETIARMIDGVSLTGSTEGSVIYLRMVLGDDSRFSQLSEEQVNSIGRIIFILAGKEEGSVEDVENLACVEEEPPMKRKSSGRR